MNRLLMLFFMTGCSDLPATKTLDESPQILVLESDYTTGLVSGWDQDFNAQIGTIPSHGDAKIVSLSTGFALLERSQTDAVTFLDHQLTILHQHELPERSNPHDLIETDDAYWISLYQNPKIIRLDKQTYQPIEPIDGRQWTDADGRPEASDLYVHSDGTILLTVQNLDFSGVEPISPDHSQLIHLRPNGELIDRYSISSNPFAPIAARDANHLLIACNHSWGIEEEAGLWQFNILTQAQELLINEEQLNGNILDFTTVGDSVFMIVSQLDFSTALYHFDLITKVIEPVAGSTSSLGCIITVKETAIYVCDRRIGDHGIRQLDSENRRLEQSLIKTTLAPLQILGR